MHGAYRSSSAQRTPARLSPSSATAPHRALSQPRTTHPNSHLKNQRYPPDSATPPRTPAHLTPNSAPRPTTPSPRTAISRASPGILDSRTAQPQPPSNLNNSQSHTAPINLAAYNIYNQAPNDASASPLLSATSPLMKSPLPTQRNPARVPPDLRNATARYTETLGECAEAAGLRSAEAGASGAAVSHAQLMTEQLHTLRNAAARFTAHLQSDGARSSAASLSSPSATALLPSTALRGHSNHASDAAHPQQVVTGQQRGVHYLGRLQPAEQQDASAHGHAADSPLDSLAERSLPPATVSGLHDINHGSEIDRRSCRTRLLASLEGARVLRGTADAVWAASEARMPRQLWEAAARKALLLVREHSAFCKVVRCAANCPLSGLLETRLLVRHGFRGRHACPISLRGTD